MTRTVLFTAALASAIGLFALGTTAQAQTQERMSIAKIATMLEGQGYRILEIELEHGRYDVDMIDGNGMKVEAYLNPVTGEVLPYRDDDRYDDKDRKNDRKYDRDDD